LLLNKGIYKIKECFKVPKTWDLLASLCFLVFFFFVIFFYLPFLIVLVGYTHFIFTLSFFIVNLGLPPTF